MLERKKENQKHKRDPCNAYPIFFRSKKNCEERTNKRTNAHLCSADCDASLGNAAANKAKRVPDRKNVSKANNKSDFAAAAVSTSKKGNTTIRKSTTPVVKLNVKCDENLDISDMKMVLSDGEEDQIFALECENEEETRADEPVGKSGKPTKPANIVGKVVTKTKNKKQINKIFKMCEVCGKVVNSKLFKEHSQLHSNPESMTCTHCGKLFSTKSTLKKHFMWTHTTLRPFMCDICGSTFKRNDHLKLHREHFHVNNDGGGTALKCGVCGSSMQTLISLQSHMKRVHGKSKVEAFDKDLNHKILPDKSYECGICNMNFKQFSYLRIHIKFVHEKGLPWHINQGANGPYKCEPCNSTFATLQSLREHNRRRHDSAPVEKFHKECDHCGMMYRNRLHYSKHLAKINGRPTCYVCWKDFDDKDILKAHINTDHLDELPFGCELCGVRFVYLSELRTHMYTHSATKEFKCEMCSQCFVRKDFLKSHMRRHLGIKNHVCEECNKSFVEFCDLRKHKQIHMKNKFTPVVVTKIETA